MDPMGTFFLGGERYHDLLSLFEFLDNGATGILKDGKS